MLRQNSVAAHSRLVVHAMPGGVGVAVSVNEGVAVGCDVIVGDGVSVGTAVGVGVSVGTSVGSGVGVGAISSTKFTGPFICACRPFPDASSPSPSRAYKAMVDASIGRGSSGGVKFCVYRAMEEMRISSMSPLMGELAKKILWAREFDLVPRLSPGACATEVVPLNPAKATSCPSTNARNLFPSRLSAI